jgi:tetratricopeptide (TPR) repeat protein
MAETLPNRCQSCGAALPADAPVALCPECWARQEETTDLPAPTPTTDFGSAGPTEGTGRTTRVFMPATQAVVSPEEHGLPRGTTIRYIGDYEVLRELGRGGMGVVYEARQISLNRPVALKMLKAGLLAGEDELRRFRNEAEAVALLDHPGIVPVYEVGEQEGQHYFAMKLVGGGSLVPMLPRYAKDPRAAAALLAEAAEAVGHAHMRGILHRDLKPANLLVDAEGHPHITDFGVAKKLEAEVELTASGAILGTPAYMSPEQASGRRVAITTATDVYGLGAVLYALLTGKAPFGGESVVDTLDAVRTQPPEPPSKVNGDVPHDLETICLKCLEKDPRRRYVTAQALADDLRAWLESRPIAARRVGAAERAWLWCKRRPAVAALSAAVLIALVGGTAAVIAIQSHANRRLAATNKKLRQSNNNLAIERQRVEVRERQAVEAIQRYGDAIANEPALKNSPELKDLRRRLLREPIGFFHSLREQLEQDARSRPESLEALSAAAYQQGRLSYEVGDRLDAEKSFVESFAILERLVREHPSEPKFRSELAKTHLGAVLLNTATGRRREAHQSVDRAIALYAELLRREPNQPDYQRGRARSQLSLGILEMQEGRPAEALEALRKARDEMAALALRKVEPADLLAELAMCHLDIGSGKLEMRQLANAVPDYREALKILDRLVRENPGVASYQFDQANAHSNIGKILALTHKEAEAGAELETARVILESLVKAYPSATDYQYLLASNSINLSRSAVAAGRFDVFESSVARARATLERLATEHPESPEFASELGVVLHNLGARRRELKKFSEARDFFREATTWQRKALRTNPAGPRFRECMNAHLRELAEIARTLGDEEAAGKAAREAAELAASDPRKAGLDARLARVLKGEIPRDNTERLALAQWAYETRRFAAAAGLWSDAFEADPKLEADRRIQYRYNAACAAALGGCGAGNNDPAPDEAARAKLRGKARDWLAAELTVWAGLLASGPPEVRKTIAPVLDHWKKDPDLAGVRGPEALDGFPEMERAAWTDLWDKVDALLSEAARR